MKHDPIASGKRKSVDLSLDIGVVDMARNESGREWNEEHRDWIAAHNHWVEGNGLPLERYRLL